MRGGYGKNKLFFLVVMSLVGIMLMPYGILGMPRSGLEKNGMKEQIADSVPVDSVVEITIMDTGRNVIYASGNGVILEMGSGEVCIVTAGHVLDRINEDAHILVGFRNQENWTQAADFETECDRYETVRDADLAFLFISAAQMEGLDLQTVPLAEKQDYDGLRAGDTVRIIGWDEGQKVIYEGELQDGWIYVEDFSQYMILADCMMRPGMSGCGLYNETDHLIGIACGGNEAGQVVAVPLHVVRARQKDLDYQSNHD